MAPHKGWATQSATRKKNGAMGNQNASFKELPCATARAKTRKVASQLIFQPHLGPFFIFFFSHQDLLSQPHDTRSPSPSPPFSFLIGTFAGAMYVYVRAGLMACLYFASSQAAHPLLFSNRLCLFLSVACYRLDPTNWAQFETTGKRRVAEDRKDQAMHAKTGVFSSHRARLATCHSRICF